LKMMSGHPNPIFRFCPSNPCPPMLPIAWRFPGAFRTQSKSVTNWNEISNMLVHFLRYPWYPNSTSTLNIARYCQSRKSSSRNLFSRF
jgi:hypothetical protein